MKSKTTTLRDYQWKATLSLSGKAAAGVRSLGLSAPTGAGKTTILHAFLMKTRQLFTGALIAAPSLATEAGFHKDDVLVYDPKWSGGRTSVIRYVMTKDMFITLRGDGDDLDKRAELDVLLSPSGHTKPFFLTTHHQLTRWLKLGALPDGPDGLRGKVLVLDEAHHAGTDDESEELNTGIGKFATAWQAGGGTVVYTTATPFRTDGLDVFPEGTETWTRSIAEHAASGFAPKDFRPVTVTVDVEAKTAAQVFGDDLSDEEDAGGCGFQTMVDRWVEDGKPKAVFVVPAGKEKRAKRWAQRLMRALEKASPGVRVVDGVGNVKVTKQRFLDALVAEGKVDWYEDSQVDVFLSCKRFDEGTDWPLCSHVYNWGVPSSFGLILQRWGRTFRDKSRYKDYPEEHRQQATIVFFVLRVGEEVLDQFEKQHHDHALLLACYLADWKTAREYRAQLRIRFEKAWTRGRKVRNEEEALAEVGREQALVVSDIVRNQMVAEIVKLEASLGRPPEAGEVREYLAKLDTTEEEWLAVERILLEHLDEEEHEEVIRKVRAKLPQQFIRADLLAAFREVTGEYRHRTVQVLDDVVSFYTRITGLEATEVASRLKDRLQKPDLTEEMIVEAAKKHHARTGKWPVQKGDASQDFGFSETWLAVSLAISTGGRGLEIKSTLRCLLQKHGLVEDDSLDSESILTAIQSYQRRTGRLPTAKSGDATEDFGRRETWVNVDSALRVGRRGGLQGGSSLPDFIERSGLRPEKVRLTLDGIRRAVLAYHTRTGNCPNQLSGDATEDFGGMPVNWRTVYIAIRKGHLGCPKGWTLGQIAADLGLCTIKPPLSEDLIIAAMKVHHHWTGEWPAGCSGGATEAFRFPETWLAVDIALRTGVRDLPGGSSLFKLRQAHGLVDDESLDYGLLVKAAVAYHASSGCFPTGRTLSEVGFGKRTTWRNVDHALRKGTHGLPGGTTLSKLLKEHGLK